VVPTWLRIDDKLPIPKFIIGTFPEVLEIKNADILQIS
jgi:hypothetical protein